MNWHYELQKQREELAKKLLHAKVLKIPSVGKDSARATIRKCIKEYFEYIESVLP